MYEIKHYIWSTLSQIFKKIIKYRIQGIISMCQTTHESFSHYENFGMSLDGEIIMSRNCELSWELSMFLVNCGKNLLRSSQVRVVFQLMLAIVAERGLASPDSTDIIISDDLLRGLVVMPYLHLTQLRQIVMSQLTLTDMGRAVRNATDGYKSIVRRLYPQQPAPISPFSAIRPTLTVTPQRIKWKMEPAMSIILIGFDSPQALEFDYILNLVTNYIATHRNRLLHPLNMEVACIRLDRLYDVFNVSYIHKSQLRGIIRDHVSPVVD